MSERVNLPEELQRTKQAECAVCETRSSLQDDVLSAEEVARWFKCSKATIYAAALCGELPSRRLGRKVIFHRPSLLAWLECKGAQKEGT